MFTNYRNMQDQLIKFFGKNFTEEERFRSYDFIEDYISENVTNWDNSPDTDTVSSDFFDEVKKLDNSQLAFLILHSGYIPEFYSHDSSQETLYSKLIEVLVCEWAIRIGFKDSFVQKQKSNKEDVTIKLDNDVIVCDAKSFRLGRSQGAPNVKDTIKKAAYASWLYQYGTPFEQKGGLITFPSLLDWKNSSEAYKYFTEGDPAIVFMFYEHCSFFLLQGLPPSTLISFMDNYRNVFPASSKSKSIYFEGFVQYVFKDSRKSFNEFMLFADQIIRERVTHTISKIDGFLAETKKSIEEKVKNTDIDKLQNLLIEAEFKNQCNQLMKQLVNIKKFRPHN